MPEQILFAAEVTLNGLMAGVLYALVALGFVLIYKASGIFSSAQGVMAFSDRVVMAYARAIVNGTTNEMRNNEAGVLHG